MQKLHIGKLRRRHRSTMSSMYIVGRRRNTIVQTFKVWCLCTRDFFWCKSSGRPSVVVYSYWDIRSIFFLNSFFLQWAATLFTHPVSLAWSPPLTRLFLLFLFGHFIQGHFKCCDCEFRHSRACWDMTSSWDALGEISGTLYSLFSVKYHSKYLLKCSTATLMAWLYIIVVLARSIRCDRVVSLI